MPIQTTMPSFVTDDDRRKKLTANLPQPGLIDSRLAPKGARLGVVAPAVSNLPLVPSVLAVLEAQGYKFDGARVAAILDRVQDLFIEKVASSEQTETTFFAILKNQLRQTVRGVSAAILGGITRMLKEHLFIEGMKRLLEPGSGIHTADRNVLLWDAVADKDGRVHEEVYTALEVLAVSLNGKNFTVAMLKPDPVVRVRLTAIKIKVIEASDFEGVLKALNLQKGQSLALTAKGNSSGFSLLDAGLKSIYKNQESNFKFSVVDNEYDLGLGAIYLTIATGSIAAREKKDLIRIGNFTDLTLSPEARRFFEQHPAFYTIHKIWHYLSQMYKFLYATAVSA